MGRVDLQEGYGHEGSTRGFASMRRPWQKGLSMLRDMGGMTALRPAQDKKEGAGMTEAEIEIFEKCEAQLEGR